MEGEKRSRRLDAYATFPRRKRYSWYLPEDTLHDRILKMDKRRTQLLDQYSENEDVGDISIGEWLELVKERDVLLRESIKQENEDAKLRFIRDLQNLLWDIPDFSPQEDGDIVKSIDLLKQNITSYCASHNISRSSWNVNFSPAPKPPVAHKKNQVSSKPTDTSNKMQNSRSAADEPMKFTQNKSVTIDNSSTCPVDVGQTVSEVSCNEATPVKLLPIPPPPPPLILNSQFGSNSERRNSYGFSLPNSNCSSLSFQEEIAAHNMSNLCHITVPKTPGDTHVKTLEHADFLQKALMKKFSAIRIHSTPKQSWSMEVSNTWSEWGASEHTCQYASDPDLTRDFTSPQQQSPVCSAADIESRVSSPNLTS